MSSSDEEDFIPVPHGTTTKHTIEQHEKFKRQMKADRGKGKAACAPENTAPTRGRPQTRRTDAVSKRPSAVSKAAHSRPAPSQPAVASMISKATRTPINDRASFEPETRPTQHGLDQLFKCDPSKKPKTKVVKTLVKKDPIYTAEDTDINKRAKKLCSQAKPWESFDAGQVDLCLQEERTACRQLLAHISANPDFKMGKTPSHYIETLSEYIKQLE